MLLWLGNYPLENLVGYDPETKENAVKLEELKNRLVTVGMRKITIDENIM